MTIRRLLLALFCGCLPALLSAAPQRAHGLTWTGHHLGSNYADINGMVGFNGRLYVTGNAGMIYSAALAPAIVQQPAHQVFVAGLPLTLRVLASGNSLPPRFRSRPQVPGRSPTSGVRVGQRFPLRRRRRSPFPSLPRPMSAATTSLSRPPPVP